MRSLHLFFDRFLLIGFCSRLHNMGVVFPHIKLVLREEKDNKFLLFSGC